MGWIKRDIDPRGHTCATPDLNDAATGSIWECDDCGHRWTIAEAEVREWARPAGFGGGTVVRRRKIWKES